MIDRRDECEVYRERGESMLQHLQKGRWEVCQMFIILCVGYVDGSITLYSSMGESQVLDLITLITNQNNSTNVRYHMLIFLGVIVTSHRMRVGLEVNGQSMNNGMEEGGVIP
jgi:hypothetical protein